MLASLCHLLSGVLLLSPASDRARDLYKQQRFDEAAIAYEQLWESEASSAYLFNAALAWQAAGRLTRANLYLRMISRRSDLGAEERAFAAERVGLLLPALTELEIEIRPGRALGPDAELRLAQGTEVIGVKLRDLDELLPLGTDGEPLVVDPRRPDSGPRTWILFLEPGEWTLQLIPRSPRTAFNGVDSVDHQVIKVPQSTGSDLTISVQFALVPENATLEVEIGEAAAARGVELRLLDPLRIRDFKPSLHEPSLTLTLPAGIWRYEVELTKHPWLWRPREPTLSGVFDLSAGGSAHRRDLAARLDRKLADERTRQIFATATAANALGFTALGSGLLGGGLLTLNRTRRYDTGSAGAFFLGGGLGLLGTTLGTVFDVGDRVWLTELALGGMTTISGAIWYGLKRSAIDRRDQEDGESQLYVSMGLVGLGAALSLGAGSALLLRRSRKARPNKNQTQRRTRNTTQEQKQKPKPKPKPKLSVGLGLVRGALRVSF